MSNFDDDDDLAEKVWEDSMSTYTKHVEQYVSTEVVIYKDGVEITEEEAEDYL